MKTPSIPALPIALALSLVSVAACAPKIPKEYEDIVPEAERGALTKVIPTDGSQFDAAKLILWYDAKKTKPGKLGDAYKAQFEKEGYELLLDCEQKDDSVDYVYGKDRSSGKEIVQFSAHVLTETTIDGSLVRSHKITTLSMGEGRECKWTDFAKKFCKTVSNDYCMLD
ncbi:MAG: hypothetical protein HOW73_19165 [Polyangiaceae bacterium]|nr:hypothetical protein [Polyangiaceae bacterium]